jgi:hypothetical protein
MYIVAYVMLYYRIVAWQSADIMLLPKLYNNMSHYFYSLRKESWLRSISLDCRMMRHVKYVLEFYVF